MNVLHIALNNPANSQKSLELALQSFGGQYHQINWGHHPNPESLTNLIVEQSNAMNADLIFMQLQTPNIVIPSKLQKAKGFKLNWSGDVRHPTPAWYYEMGKVVDLTCFTNLEDVDNLRVANIPADYLQIGYEEEIYKPEGPTGNFAEICFLGSNYIGSKLNFQLSAEREAMVNALTKRYDRRFAVYGHNWPQSGNTWIGRQDEEEQKAYHSCKIAINHNHYCYRRYTSDRALRIMACGAFCLNRWYPEIEKEFIDGVHLVNWGSLGTETNFKQLKDYIDYYLEHDDERNAIAKQGYKHVQETCTWTSRMEDLKRLIDKYKSHNKEHFSPSPIIHDKITDINFFTDKIQNKEPFVFVKFGDGDLLCMQGRKGSSCDGQVFSPKLAESLVQSFSSILQRSNVYMGDWTDELHQVPQMQKKYLSHFKIKPNFTDFDLFLSVENNMQDDKLLNFYKAVKQSNKNKLFIGPKRLHGVIDMLDIDEYIVTPVENCFDKYEEIKNKLLSRISDDDIVIFACGKTSKPLCRDILALEKNTTIIEAGSAFDPIFVEITRSKQCSTEQCKEYYKELL